MKFYKLTYDMDSIDKLSKEEKNFIYAEESNLKEIECAGVKKGFFHNIIFNRLELIDWPKVKFYYSSIVSNRESDYLLNVNRWPVIHERVKAALEKENIKGIKFYKIDLCDVVTGQVNTNYSVIYIENFIDAFDLTKSKYKYNEKYDMYTFVPKQTFLNLDNCRGYDIFRCSKSVAGIYVSDKFYKIINNYEFTCFYFEEQLLN